MDITEAIYGRRSTREFSAQAISDATIRKLIGAAIQAPSAVNEQPWTFTVIRNSGVLDPISRDAKVHMLAMMPKESRSQHFRPMLDDAEFHIFYHAPLLIVISASTPGPWISEDCAFAATSSRTKGRLSGSAQRQEKDRLIRRRIGPAATVFSLAHD